jgi:hypothetical protein
MPYNLHPSERLRECFRAKPWQGAPPLNALFLFVGLDANYDPDIEKTLPEVFDYLEDGVAFWKRNGKGVHHPFRLPHYHGNGKKYHDRFAQIGFSPESASWVSFVELLHLPTIGRSSLIPSDLNSQHLRSLAGVLEEGSAKYIFLPDSVARLMRSTKYFPWLRRTPLRTDGDLPVWYEQNGQTVYGVYHFSCWGKQLTLLNKQIAQIGAIVSSLREPWGELFQKKPDNECVNPTR